MARWLATLLICAVASAPLRADVTITSAVTVDGGAGALMGAGTTPKLVMRIKGSRMRTEIEAGDQTIVTIADLTTKQLFLLRPDQKTAQSLGPEPAADTPGGPPATMPKIDTTTKPTGQSRTIDGVPCEEQAISMSMDLSALSGGAPASPGAADMLKGVHIALTGSTWIATSGPGVADYIAFRKAAEEANLSAMVSRAMPGMAAGTLNQIINAAASGSGLPYLTEVNLSIEGTGPMIDLLKQLGAMKITSKVTAVATDQIPDDMFKVPDDYTIGKQ